jgi:hypothetical protein
VLAPLSFSDGGKMTTQALLLELLVSGFFAIACFKARPAGDLRPVAVRPQDLLRLTDRITRLSRTRWQWFAMVGILALVRVQIGVPLTVEVTAAIQFIVFMALPVAREARLADSAKSPEPPSRSKMANRHHRRAVAAAAGPAVD